MSKCFGPHLGWGKVGAVGPVWALQWNILLTVPGRRFFYGSFMCLSCVCCVFMRVCLCVLSGGLLGGGGGGGGGGADLLALVCGVCCEFVAFPLVSWVRCGT